MKPSNRKIVTWEFWRIGIGSSPRQVWDMSDRYIAGGMAELYDWNTHPNYHLWRHDNKPYEVRWWQPDRVVSIMSAKRFETYKEAARFYNRLIKRGYVAKGT